MPKVIFIGNPINFERQAVGICISTKSIALPACLLEAKLVASRFLASST
jgi:hypothetical protein